MRIDRAFFGGHRTYFFPIDRTRSHQHSRRQIPNNFQIFLVALADDAGPIDDHVTNGLREARQDRRARTRS